MRVLTKDEWRRALAERGEVWAWVAADEELVYLYEAFLQEKDEPSTPQPTSLAYHVPATRLLGMMLAYGTSWPNHVLAGWATPATRWPSPDSTFADTLTTLGRRQAVLADTEELTEDVLRRYRHEIEHAYGVIDGEDGHEPGHHPAHTPQHMRRH